MTQLFQQAVLEVQKLSAEEQDAIAALIFEEIKGGGDVPQWHKDELDRRLSAFATDPQAGSSWDEARLQSRA